MKTVLEKFGNKFRKINKKGFVMSSKYTQNKLTHTQNKFEQNVHLRTNTLKVNKIFHNLEERSKEELFT